MVNYQYDLDDIEKNHEAFAENRTVAAANGDQEARADAAGAGEGVNLSAHARESGHPGSKNWVPAVSAAASGLRGLRYSPISFKISAVCWPSRGAGCSAAIGSPSSMIGVRTPGIEPAFAASLFG